MNRHAVIVSGGTVEESFLRARISGLNDIYIIGVDKGMEVLYRNQIVPDQLVGDFDSVSKEIMDYYRAAGTVKIRAYNPEKDASDTEIAVRLAMELGCEKISIFGATGTRLDHMWANVQVLYQPLKAGIDAEILDPHNRIRLIDSTTVLCRETAFGPFFSVFPLGGEVPHFFIKGGKYPLCNHTLAPYNSLCVSNEFVEDEVEISFLEGIVILMETRDV